MEAESWWFDGWVAWWWEQVVILQRPQQRMMKMETNDEMWRFTKCLRQIQYTIYTHSNEIAFACIESMVLS